VNTAALRDRFERALPQTAIVFGANAARLSNTSNFALPGLAAETAVMALDSRRRDGQFRRRLFLRKGEASHVLRAMGVSEDIACCALRVSFGWDSTEDDVDAVIASLTRLTARIRPREAA